MSENTSRDHGFLLPPHRNAEVHKKIMAELARMTPDELFETVVRAGIYDRDGNLLPPYADEEEEQVKKEAKIPEEPRARRSAKAEEKVTKKVRSKTTPPPKKTKKTDR